MSYTECIPPAQDVGKNIIRLLKWPETVWEPKLTVSIDVRFSTGEMAGRETYHLTRGQLMEVVSRAKLLEAGR